MSKKTNSREVPIIQLVPPLIFLRKRKRERVLGIIGKLMKGVMPKGRLRKFENNSSQGGQSQSKRVYTK